MNRADSIDVIDCTESSAYFDEAIGHIQDIILSEEFQQLHEDFFEQHWRSFDYEEENKISDTIIYESYQLTFESHLTTELCMRMQHFDMQRFDLELSGQRRSHKMLENDIIELIDSMSDFQKFKCEMLDYRSQKEGRLAYMEAGNILVTRSYGQRDAAE